MKARHEYLYFPVALSHMNAGQISAARECFQIALHHPLTPAQIERLVDTTVIWAMSRPHKMRAAELDAVLTMLASIHPHHLQPSDLARKVMNHVHHAWAFEAYTLRQWPEVSRHVVDTFRTNPALIRDRGLLSIWARSALERVGFAVSQPQPDAEADCEGVFAEDARRRVEALVGEPVQGWNRINSFTPIKPRHFLYTFSDTQGCWIVRQAVRGDVLPPAQLMQSVAQAGVPAPACRIEQLGTAHTPGLRIEAFVQGNSLDLHQHSPQQVAHLVAQLGEAIQHLHGVPAGGFGLLTANLRAPGDSFMWMRDQLEQETLLALLGLDYDIAPARWVNIADHALTLLDETPYAGPAVLSHGDLNPGNILVRNGELAGLIDWEFVQGNDPAFDIAVFLTFTCGYWRPLHGHAFIDQVTEAFEGATSPELMRRVMAYLVLCMLQEINFAVRFSHFQPWRDAEQMREYLLNAGI